LINFGQAKKKREIDKREKKKREREKKYIKKRERENPPCKN